MAIKFKKFGKLPGRPSALITLALKDLAKVERSKKYEVHMSIWHAPLTSTNRKKKCAVCFAGAVMAKTMNISAAMESVPEEFAKERDALLALDHFRNGEVLNGLKKLGLERPSHWLFNECVHICYYEDNAKAFHRDMEHLASDMEYMGL